MVNFTARERERDARYFKSCVLKICLIDEWTFGWWVSETKKKKKDGSLGKLNDMVVLSLTDSLMHRVGN